MNDLRNMILRSDMKEQGRKDRKRIKELEGMHGPTLSAEVGRLKARIEELKALADPLTRALYNEMRISHKAIVLEKKELKARVEQLEEKLLWKEVSHIAADERIKELEADLLADENCLAFRKVLARIKELEAKIAEGDEA